jgi:uncharacterized membrane protein YfcA
MPWWFVGLVAVASVVAGATGSIVGFGIGSLLTPLVSTRFGMDLAVAAVALPHLAGGLLRAWRLRHSIDGRVLVRFGILSAAGGLIGALVFVRLAPTALGRVLGALLILTAAAGITGWLERWRPTGFLVWALGALSGFFGGVVGNQGGLRAAALSALALEPTVFVATSTMIGVVIDLVRAPIYLYGAGDELVPIWPLVAWAVAGVLAGTLIGERLLLGLSRTRFRTLVSSAIGLIGAWLVFRPA